MKAAVPFAMKMRIRVRPTILLFGDSITEFGFGIDGAKLGWASLLSSTYSRRADVLSRGFSGYNTQHALGVLPSVFEESDPNGGGGNANPPLLFCTVFFGANDASMPSARQHLNIEDYTNNIRKIVMEIRSRATFSEENDEKDDPETSSDAAPPSKKKPKHSKNPKLPIVLLTPPPVSSTAWDHYCTITSPRPLSPRSNENAKLYGERILKLGKELDCAVVDTFSILGGHHENGEMFYNQYLTDGLHLNDTGNELVYHGIMDALKSKSDYSHLLPATEEEEDSDVGDGGSVPLEEKLWSELC